MTSEDIKHQLIIKKEVREKGSVKYSWENGILYRHYKDHYKQVIVWQ